MSLSRRSPRSECSPRRAGRHDGRGAIHPAAGPGRNGVAWIKAERIEILPPARRPSYGQGYDTVGVR